MKGQVAIKHFGLAALTRRKPALQISTIPMWMFPFIRTICFTSTWKKEYTSEYFNLRAPTFDLAKIDQQWDLSAVRHLPVLEEITLRVRREFRSHGRSGSRRGHSEETNHPIPVPQCVRNLATCKQLKVLTLEDFAVRESRAHLNSAPFDFEYEFIKGINAIRTLAAELGSSFTIVVKASRFNPGKRHYHTHQPHHPAWPASLDPRRWSHDVVQRHGQRCNSVVAHNVFSADQQEQLTVAGVVVRGELA